MSSQILIDNLSFSYESKPLIQNLSLSVQAGEILTLIGASGSGKTTLLKLLCGLLTCQQGNVALCQERLPAAKRHIAFMMQQDVLLPWRTILGNVMLAAELTETSVKKAEALDLLKAVDLAHCADLFPEALSGGMRQRVALARVLLQKRAILLLDEPFANLDVLLREQLYLLLRTLRSQFGLTIILVTHDFRDALVLSDRIALLSNGTIEQQWSIPSETHLDPVAMADWQKRLRTSIYTSNFIC
ncbi:MAG: ATP-binding cassette domain-containing protein [Chlamydiales bacterium]|nr:ATP-binding cassette domain-containing protein [Chlamydiales bacterium]